MEWGTPVQWGWFLLFSRSGGHKTKETYLTRPGSPTPCKRGLSWDFLLSRVQYNIKFPCSTREFIALGCPALSILCCFLRSLSTALSYFGKISGQPTRPVVLERCPYREVRLYLFVEIQRFLKIPLIDFCETSHNRRQAPKESVA